RTAGGARGPGGVGGGRRPTTGGGDGAGGARGGGVGAAGSAPGAAQGAGELGQSLDRVDGGRRAPGGADGQQHRRAGPTRPGGRSEELLRQWRGVGGPVGGHAVLVVSDAVLVGAEPAGVVDGLPDGVRGGGGPGACRSRAFPAVEPECGG